MEAEVYFNKLREVKELRKLLFNDNVFLNDYLITYKRLCSLNMELIEAQQSQNCRVGKYYEANLFPVDYKIEPKP